MTITCLNCGHVLGGRFCESCGQRAGLQTFTLRALVQQVPKAVFDVDRGVWHTMKGLLMRPGEVINGYLDGRRIRYTNPLALALLFGSISAALYLSGWLDFSKLSYGEPAGTQQLMSTLTRWSFQYYAATLLLMVPLVSAITRCLFAASRRNYAEHLIINTYITAETVVITTCVFPLLVAVNDSWLLEAWNSTLAPLTILYHVFALVQVFSAQAARIKVVPRAIAAVVSYYFIAGLVIGIPAAVYAARTGLLRP